MADDDALDFPSSLSSPLLAPDSDPLFDSYIDSNACLDQAFVRSLPSPPNPPANLPQCSNFSCCGQSLPDLHHLLDHFEQVHVLPFPPDDRPTYSSPVYARPAGPHASYILSYPQPDPPLHPLPPVLSSAHGPLRVVPDVNQIPDLSLSPPSSSASSCVSSPILGEPLCLPPALFSSHPPSSSTPSQRRRAGPHRNTKPHPRPDPLARHRLLAHASERAAPHPGSRKRDGREKAYKCPHAGCTKSYLNPNGLKYHLDKGTCTTVGARSQSCSHLRGHLEFAAGTGTEAEASEPTAFSEAPSVSGSDAGSEAEDDALEDRT
ncbi:hypothetical protein C8Q78DRAFT_763323 [Trametes maxima]|nr:hypothetical protein C8Q78DRAFT_763323 [Trametes maxima]